MNFSQGNKSGYANKMDVYLADIHVKRSTFYFLGNVKSTTFPVNIPNNKQVKCL